MRVKEIFTGRTPEGEVVLSPSRVITLSQCLRAYYLRYFLEVVVPVSPYLSVGKYLHSRVFEDIFNRAVIYNENDNKNNPLIQQAIPFEEEVLKKVRQTVKSNSVFSAEPKIALHCDFGGQIGGEETEEFYLWGLPDIVGFEGEGEKNRYCGNPVYFPLYLDPDKVVGVNLYDLKVTSRSATPTREWLIQLGLYKMILEEFLREVNLQNLIRVFLVVVLREDRYKVILQPVEGLPSRVELACMLRQAYLAHKKLETAFKEGKELFEVPGNPMHYICVAQKGYCAYGKICKKLFEKRGCISI
jgi:hypothetical protein